MSDIIQSLWIGNELSPLEVLSIESFLQNDHEYHLYTYGDVKNIPKGTIIKDGNEILDESNIFTYKTRHGRGSYSAFSNFFRYKMLLTKGGYWSDTDNVCIRHFDFDIDYVFSSERNSNNKVFINAGIIKCPAGDDFAKHCWNVCENTNKDTVLWGTLGPKLVSSTVEKYNLNEYVQPPEAFCPVGWEPAYSLWSGNHDIPIPPQTYSIHMWNEIMRRKGVNKHGIHSPNSVFEKLKKKYNVK